MVIEKLIEYQVFKITVLLKDEFSLDAENIQRHCKTNFPSKNKNSQVDVSGE